MKLGSNYARRGHCERCIAGCFPLLSASLLSPAAYQLDGLKDALCNLWSLGGVIRCQPVFCNTRCCAEDVHVCVSIIKCSLLGQCSCYKQNPRQSGQFSSECSSQTSETTGPKVQASDDIRALHTWCFTRSCCKSVEDVVGSLKNNSHDAGGPKGSFHVQLDRPEQRRGRKTTTGRHLVSSRYHWHPSFNNLCLFPLHAFSSCIG